MNYSNEEEYQRSVIGRFYYACFGLAKEYYEKTHKQIVPHKESHAFLIKKLKCSVYDEEKELGKQLGDLRKYRNNADYDNKFHYGNLKKARKTSDDMIDLLKKLKVNPVVSRFS